VTVAESTLRTAKAEFEGEAGDFLGWGRGTANGEEAWNAFKQRAIDSLMKSAQAKVYCKPQLNPPDGPIHQWTFLTPTGTAALPSGGRYADLPDDFGFLVGQMAVTTDGQTGYFPVNLDSEPKILGLYSRFPSATGRPQLVAEESLSGVTLDRSTRGRLHVYPQADRNYTLSFTYTVVPNLMAAGTPFPYGGPQHAETFKAAVRAAAELYLDNKNVNGPEQQNYMVCLAASIAYDRKRKAQVVGYNADRSDALDARGWGWSPRQPWGHLDTPTITIAGLDPS
jgi:hypothetical protein